MIDVNKRNLEYERKIHAMGESEIKEEWDKVSGVLKSMMRIKKKVLVPVYRSVKTSSGARFL